MLKQEYKLRRFFDQLSEQNKQLLLDNGTKKKYRKHTVLFSEGEQPDHVYLVLSGMVRLSKMTMDGKEFSLHLKQKDELVGEVGLFNQMAISVTATVEEDAELVRFSRLTLEKLFEEHGEIAVAFMKWFATHTQSTQAKFRDLILCGKKGGLYSTLIRFSNSYGEEHKDGTMIRVQLTNQDIAQFIGTTREGVNRLMNELKKESIVSYEGPYIILRDVQYLKDFLQCGDCPVEVCTI
ncbi:Crp/Fnr family transcriptional regulator [Alkalicoccus saliphilus]|jgi:CRP/FNR family transcriptional regulator, cyclic AMP receptor protein|uniref:Crp/Fnr family transcriptional regulator n=1 Tax=Alkalicoccus saliphilus TaxID=200989 RepID=A0A2T4U5S6_9BACI|nr:Crp/Fnr family transcriptional regulator [Alkalicoccus saliphilus]PTL38757.1 Crp/Fnr family transcriptional regulator [Alkalicoccus saliphilus]